MPDDHDAIARKMMALHRAMDGALRELEQAGLPATAVVELLAVMLASYAIASKTPMVLVVDDIVEIGQLVYCNMQRGVSA